MKTSPQKNNSQTQTSGSTILGRCVSAVLMLLWGFTSDSFGEITLEKVGDPVFEVVFDVGRFAVDGSNLASIVPILDDTLGPPLIAQLPNDSVASGREWDAGPHIPVDSLDVSLTRFIREQHAAMGVVNTNAHLAEDFGFGNARFNTFHIAAAENAPMGASPTGELVPVIPNDIFPLKVDLRTIQSGIESLPVTWQMQSLSNVGEFTDAHGVDRDFTGLNYDELIFSTWNWPDPNASAQFLVGPWEQRHEIIDRNGNGWRLSIPFDVVLEATDVEGDLSYSGALDLHDYNILQQNVEVAPAEPHGEFLRRLDLNGDNLVNADDTSHLVSLFPETEVSSLSVGETYSQDLDSLGADGTVGSALPNGWSVPDRFGGPLVKETNAAFPTSSRDIRAVTAPHALNVGLPEGEGVQDRSLAIYKPRNTTDTSSIQLLADTDTQANALKVDFSVEAWDRIRATNGNRDGGEAAFNVTVEIDSGDGTSDMSKILGGEFTELVNLGMVTTGAELPAPDGDYLDGNDPAHRVAFASDILHADIPAGSRLRFRWETTGEADASEEWIFGIDDVSITLAAAGDTNLDGEVKFDDFLALSANFGEEGGWEQGDFDGDGTIDFPDFLALSANFVGPANASAASVPEPTAQSIALFGLLGMIGFRKRR